MSAYVVLCPILYDALVDGLHQEGTNMEPFCPIQEQTGLFLVSAPWTIASKNHKS